MEKESVLHKTQDNAQINYDCATDYKVKITRYKMTHSTPNTYQKLPNMFIARSIHIEVVFYAFWTLLTDNSPTARKVQLTHSVSHYLCCGRSLFRTLNAITHQPDGAVPIYAEI